ncbi:MAG: hypothetical protein H0X27_00650 [Caulobacteraceae bacterium]|nr:hypothetical protein [Caulobacteraceae bacterium]
MNEPAKFWMLIPWGRVGSNLLLNNLKQIVGPDDCSLINENLSVTQSVKTQLSWVREFYAQQTPLALIGCKQNIRSVAAPRRLSSLLENLGIALIRLRRENYVKVAISQLRAELYAKRSVARFGVAKWGVRNGREPLESAPLDARRFLKGVGLAKHTDGLLARFTPDVPTLDLEYRQLQTGSDQVAADVCQWLGLAVSRPATPAFVKATPDNLEDAVPNLRELREALSRSTLRELAHMFDD